MPRRVEKRIDRARAFELVVLDSCTCSLRFVLLASCTRAVGETRENIEPTSSNSVQQGAVQRSASE
jgi:hypothetical protein